jgi:hypothetical protein
LLRHIPKAELFLVTDAIRAIYPENAERLLASWRERGVQEVTSNEILTGRRLERYLPAPV